MGKKSREKRARYDAAAHPSGMAPPGANPREPSVHAATAVRNEVSRQSAGAWHVAECERAEALLAAGNTGEARTAFESVLGHGDRLSRYLRAAVLGRLGVCLRREGRHDDAVATTLEAISVAADLGPEAGALALRGTLHSALGDAYLAANRLDDAWSAQQQALRDSHAAGDARAQAVDLAKLATLALQRNDQNAARSSCERAIEIFQSIGDPVAEAAMHHNVAAVAERCSDEHGAAEHFRSAARIRQSRGLHREAAASLAALAALHERRGDAEAAESCYREAIGSAHHLGGSLQLADLLGRVALLASRDQTRASEARQVAQQALAIAQSVEPCSPQSWDLYACLASCLEAEAGIASSEAVRVDMLSHAAVFREVSVRAKKLAETLEHLAPSARFARAVILGRIGKCYQLGTRVDLAVATYRKAIDEAGRIAGDRDCDDLMSLLHAELGGALQSGDMEGARRAYRQCIDHAGAGEDILAAAIAHLSIGDIERTINRPEDAMTAWHHALRLARRMRDEGLAERIVERLLNLGDDVALASSREDAAAVEMHATIAADYVFDGDLLVDGPRLRQICIDPPPPEALLDELAAGALPMLLPTVRTYADDDDVVCFESQIDDTTVSRRDGCEVLRRVRKCLRIARRSPLAWAVVRFADGTRTIDEIGAAARLTDTEGLRQLVAALATAGMIDRSGRGIGRLLHRLTKKGVLPGGGLGSTEVLQLVTDGNYRMHGGAGGTRVDDSTPVALEPFHRLTRRRRSRRDYNGHAIAAADVNALLHTACGVTGTIAWSGREVKLRAYPSSGALYAVEIYPLLLAVDGMCPGLYHFRAGDSMLEEIRRDVDRRRLVEAMLPVERDMVAGAAAMICLVGSFRRHECKYGPGGYRMLIAEAGHVSQNLVLAATALGLEARPFGGVFDDLMNEELRLDDDDQFLLSVLVGHAGTAGRPVAR